MNLESLTDLLIEELRDLYDAEQQLLKALPKVAEAAFSGELREAMQLHLEQTRGQVERLEKIFTTLKVPSKGKRCRAMQGLIEEAEELLEKERSADPTVLDAALIMAQQKVEHYEIAGYGCARTFARTLGAKEAERLLQQTLDEEAETDRKLTLLAESTINLDAAENDAEIAAEAAADKK
jgi:ferritin-like metal-binding protein YciE